MGGLGCNQADRTPPPAAEPEERDAPEVEDVVEEPLSFYGKSVTLLGEVDTVFSDRAFELEGNDWLFDDEIIVVTRSPIRLGLEPLADDDRVVVTGVVHRMELADFERELGWGPTETIEVEIEHRPVLVADSIHTTTHVARWSEEEDDREGVLLGPTLPLGTVLAETLYGRRAELTRAEVRRTTTGGLWVGSSHRMQTFVSAPEGFDPASVKAGDRVTVRGYFRMMPPADDAITRWGIEPTLRPQIEEELVYVDATTIEPIEPVAIPPVQLADVIAMPALYAGRMIDATAKVTAVPSDRGFWIEAGEGEDEKIFAMLREDDPEHAHIDVNPGDMVKFSGLVLMPHRMSDLVLPLEQDAREGIEKSGVFLNIHWSDIEKTGAS